MKKKIFLALAMLCILLFAFSMAINAEENVPEVTHTYYLVQSLDSEAAQGLENAVAIDSLIGSVGASDVSPFFGQFEDGSHIELILAENILTAPESGKGILINKAITITIRYNGFTHVIDNGLAYTGICMRNAGATLRMIGTKAFDLNDGTDYSLTFNKPTGDIGKGTFNLNGCNADAYHYGKVYCWVFAGNVYAENMRTITGQEFVFSESGGATGTYEFKKCVSSSNSTALGFEGQSPKTVKIDGGYYEGLTAFSVLTGSYVRNAKIVEKGIYMDCWGITNQVWEFTNCQVDALSTATGRTHFKFVNCKLKPEIFKNLGSDGGGKGYALVYDLPTCISAGTLNIYRNGSNGLPVTDDTKYPYSLVEDYARENPALGHNYVKGEVNNNYCPMGQIFDCTCSCCDFAGTIDVNEPEAELVLHIHTKVNSVVYAEGYAKIGVITFGCTNDSCNSAVEQSTSKPLITSLGFSASELGNQICIGYTLDKEMLSLIGSINSSFEIGVVAAVETVVNTNSPIIKGENGQIEKISNNVIKAKIENDGITRVDMRINGDFANQYKTLPMLMSAYVFDGNEISYINDGVEKYYEITTKTYEQIVA